MHAASHESLYRTIFCKPIDSGSARIWHGADRGWQSARRRRRGWWSGVLARGEQEAEGDDDGPGDHGLSRALYQIGSAWHREILSRRAACWSSRCSSRRLTARESSTRAPPASRYVATWRASSTARRSLQPGSRMDCLSAHPLVSSRAAKWWKSQLRSPTSIPSTATPEGNASSGKACHRSHVTVCFSR